MSVIHEIFCQLNNGGQSNRSCRLEFICDVLAVGSGLKFGMNYGLLLSAGFFFVLVLEPTGAQWATRQTTVFEPRPFARAWWTGGRLILSSEDTRPEVLDVSDRSDGTAWAGSLAARRWGMDVAVLSQGNFIFGGGQSIDDSAHPLTHCTATQLYQYDSSPNTFFTIDLYTSRCVRLVAMAGDVVVVLGNDGTFDVLRTNSPPINNRTVGVHFPSPSELVDFFSLGSVGSKAFFMTVEASVPYYWLLMYDGPSQTWSASSYGIQSSLFAIGSVGVFYECVPTVGCIGNYNVYYPSTNTWKPFSSSNRNSHVYSYQSRVYFVGSSASLYKVLVDVYDSTTDTWSSLPGPDSVVGLDVGAVSYPYIVFPQGSGFHLEFGNWTTFPGLSVRPVISLTAGNSAMFIGTGSGSRVDIWTYTDYCASSPCNASLLCVNGINGYQCNCTSGVSNCTTPAPAPITDPCSKGPCVHGECLSSSPASSASSSYRCACSGEYYGTLCDKLPLSSSAVFGIGVGAAVLVMVVLGVAVCLWVRFGGAKPQRAPNVSHVIQSDHV